MLQTRLQQGIFAHRRLHPSQIRQAISSGIVPANYPRLAGFNLPIPQHLSRFPRPDSTRRVASRPASLTYTPIQTPAEPPRRWEPAPESERPWEPKILATLKRLKEKNAKIFDTSCVGPDRRHIGAENAPGSAMV